MIISEDGRIAEFEFCRQWEDGCRSQVPLLIFKLEGVERQSVHAALWKHPTSRYPRHLVADLLVNEERLIPVGVFVEAKVAGGRGAVLPGAVKSTLTLKRWAFQTDLSGRQLYE